MVSLRGRCYSGRMQTQSLLPPAAGPSTPKPADDRARHSRNLVARLRQAEIYREYAQAFQTTTGLPLGLRPVGSLQSSFQGSKQVNPFCTLMAKTSKSCSACLQLQQKVEEDARLEARTIECFAGLSESAIPIRVGDEVVAYLQTGQVLLQAPTKTQFARAARQLTAWGVPPADLKAFETAYFQTRVIARPHYGSMVRLLGIFAEHLSVLSNQLMIQEINAEPPAVTQARTYITAHHAEEIALADVAQAVHMSVFYFCKIFKLATGMTFTDYLSHVRVEKVKTLLLNPHLRVSEAAYAVGFQSLSQFNRSFHRLAGESPSDYRDRLHQPGRSGPGFHLPHAA